MSTASLETHMVCVGRIPFDKKVENRGVRYIHEMRINTKRQVSLQTINAHCYVSEVVETEN